MSGRADIWQAALSVIPERPVLGAGLGAFITATNNHAGAHNLLLGVLVEEGLVGFSLYVGLLAACAVAIVRMPFRERMLWVSLMLAWLVGVMSLNWEYRKVTWLLFGLVAAEAAMERRLSRHLVTSDRPSLETASSEVESNQFVDRTLIPHSPTY